MPYKNANDDYDGGVCVGRSGGGGGGSVINKKIHSEQSLTSYRCLLPRSINH